MRYDVTKLKRARMLKGLTASDLAAMIGKTPTTITRIEAGLSARPSTIKKLADVLEVPMIELLTEEE